MTFVYRVISAATLLAAGAAASAATVHVQFDNPLFSGVAAPAYDAVSIRYPGQGGGASATASVAAGRFQGTASNLQGIDPSVLVDNVADLYLYCYDLYEHVGNGWSVDYTVNYDGEAARTLDFLGAVNAVLSQGQAQVDPFAWLHPSNGLMAAAIQLGIWESKYDSGDWRMGDGAFQATGLETQTASYLADFLAAMPGTAALDGRYVMVLEAAGVQDMITGDPPSKVPEPGTLALAAVAGFAGLARRRRRQRG